MKNIETNWYVLTGGPCSGKSTTLEHLSSKGYLVIPEMARVVIDEGLTAGQTIDQIRGDEISFQSRVLDRKIKLERELSVDSITFLDRGMPDTIAYYRNLGISVPVFLLGQPEWRYKSVFFMEQLPFTNDYGRIESEEDALKLSTMLYMSYIECGYTLIKVPIMSVEERAKFIIEKVTK